jgi:DNA-binding transcriptional regulator YhcF (GntR family)
MKKFNPGSHVPLYKQLEHYLIGQMRKGVYQNGQALPSINELDKKMHLGRVTIVQAMKVLTEDGFAISKRGKGFYARIPKINELVGVVAPFHSAHMDIYSNLLAGLRNAGIKNTFLSSEEDPNIFKHSVDEFIDYQGLTRLIVIPPWDKDMHVRDSIEKFLVDRKEKLGVEIIVVDREVEADFLQITQDKSAGIKLLLQRARENGSKKIIAFSSAIREHKKLFTSLVEKEFPDGEVVFKRKVEPAKNLKEDLEAIVVEKADTVFANDDIHARLLVKEAGGKIDFKLAGYNGTPSAFSIQPMITTINSNLAEAGTYAYEHFFEGKYSRTDKLKLTPFLMPGETF